MCFIFRHSLLHLTRAGCVFRLTYIKTGGYKKHKSHLANTTTIFRTGELCRQFMYSEFYTVILWRIIEDRLRCHFHLCLKGQDPENLFIFE